MDFERKNKSIKKAGLLCASKMFLIITALLFSNHLRAQSASFEWAKSVGGTSNDVGNSISIDNLGNIYTTGYFYNTVDFDPGAGTFNLYPSGNGDIFISKLDALGNFVWAKSIGGVSSDQALSIVTDSANFIYITGYFSGQVDFDPSVGSFGLTSVGYTDMFILKLDSSGNFVWAKNMGGSLNTYGSFITTNSSGYIYTTGYFQGTTDFDPNSGTFYLTSSGDDDIFILKLDSLGNFVWAKQLGGVSRDFGSSIAVDYLGNVYSTGTFEGTADFNPGAGIFNLSSLGYTDIFISKLDDSGNFVWAKQIAGISRDFGNAVCVDTWGSVYITGEFEGIVDFDPSVGIFNLSSQGYEDIFVAKLDAFGNLVWAKNIGGTFSDSGTSITTDNDGNVYTTGLFEGTADFNPDSGIFNLSSAGSWDIFITKLNASGNMVWAKNMGGFSADIGNCIAIDETGNVITTGSFQFTSDFNPDAGIFNLTSIDTDDIFIHKMSQAPVGINEIEALSYISIYPNPNNGIFTIELNSNTQIIITNILGEEILNKTMVLGKQNLNLQDQANGVYFVKVIQNGKQQVVKIIKEN